MSIRILLSCIALALLPQGALAQITVNLDADGRPAAEKERDATSKPMEVLEWIGVEEGDNVLDIESGGGYHTWIFSDAVGPEGKVYSQSSFRPESLQARIASGATPEANVTFVSDIAEVPDASLDLAFTDRNYHDVNPGEVPAWLATLMAKLKPGVEIGTGNALSPPSGFFRSSPLITTSWHGAEFTRTGGIGWLMACSQAEPISSIGRPMPMA